MTDYGFGPPDDGVSLPIADVPKNLPCCGVFATALAARVDFRTVWNLMAAHRKRPGAWKGRTGDKDRERAMKVLGVKFRFSRLELTFGGMVWGYVHKDYDGPEDSRHGYCATFTECLDEIDEEIDP